MVENSVESTKKAKCGKKYCKKYGQRFGRNYYNVLIHCQYLVDVNNDQKYSNSMAEIGKPGILKNESVALRYM